MRLVSNLGHLPSIARTATYDGMALLSLSMTLQPGSPSRRTPLVHFALVCAHSELMPFKPLSQVASFIRVYFLFAGNGFVRLHFGMQCCTVQPKIPCALSTIWRKGPDPRNPRERGTEYYCGNCLNARWARLSSSRIARCDEHMGVSRRDTSLRRRRLKQAQTILALPSTKK